MAGGDGVSEPYSTQLTPMPVSAKLAEALVAAQLAAREVEKAGRHQHQNYMYVRADDMIAEGRAALGTAGLSLLTLGWTFEPGETKGGDKHGAAIGRVVIRYLLSHKAGDSLHWTSSTFVVPGNGRPADKAEMGAITENLSYTIRGLLLLPRVDEGTSIETRDDRREESRGHDCLKGEQGRYEERGNKPAPVTIDERETCKRW